MNDATDKQGGPNLIAKSKVSLHSSLPHRHVPYSSPVIYSIDTLMVILMVGIPLYSGKRRNTFSDARTQRKSVSTSGLTVGNPTMVKPPTPVTHFASGMVKNKGMVSDSDGLCLSRLTISSMFRWND